LVVQDHSRPPPHAAGGGKKGKKRKRTAAVVVLMADIVTLQALNQPAVYWFSR
jgi:hypothetical protein